MVARPCVGVACGKGGLWTEHLHVVACVACLNRSHDSVCEYEHTVRKVLLAFTVWYPMVMV